MSKPPFEFCMDRWPDDGSYSWPGNYAAYYAQCAWVAWQARADLSAGDAVLAEREACAKLCEEVADDLITAMREEGETDDEAMTSFVASREFAPKKSEEAIARNSTYTTPQSTQPCERTSHEPRNHHPNCA